MATNVDLPKERIDALLAAEVYHHDSSNAQDLDSICTTKTMQCLVGYALQPSFLDPAYLIAIKLARDKIAQLVYSINEQLDIAKKYNVNFDVDKAPESICCKEPQDLNSRLEEEARAKNKPKAFEKVKQGDKGKGKKVVTQKRPASRSLKSRLLHFDNSPISEEEEQEIVPPLTKRKRKSPTSRAQSSYVIQTLSPSTTIASPPSATLVSGPAPSPNEDEHLTIKKLKTQQS